MTTVRVPVRIRLELPGDRFDAGLLDLVGAATGRASARAVDRAGRTVARTGAAWSGREPEVSVRFRGDPVPEWVAGHLETHVRAAAVRAGQRLAAAAPASTMTVTPIVLTRQLSRFGTAEELYRALERYFAGEPVPPRLLVIAADRAGTAYLFLVADQAVTVLHAMAQWQPQPDGRDAELVTGYSGLNADELRFVTAAETEPAFRTGLARVLLDTQRTAFPTLSEQRLAAQARDRAARYPWRGPKTVLYEFMSQGSPIKAYIYVGDNEPTRSAIPVVTLSEDAPFEPAARTRPPAPALPPPAVADLDPDRPFGHELALADWDPAEYAELSALIDEVLAQTGGGAPPRFVGSFVLATLAGIERKAEQLGWWTGSADRKAELKYHALAVQALNKLLLTYTGMVSRRARAGTLPPPLAGNGSAWLGALHREYFPRRRRVVAALFIAACQDALLDVLERSATEIGHRLTGDDWLPATRLVLTVLLEDLPELYELRRKLAGIKEFWRTSTAMVLDLTQTYEFQGATIRYEPIPGRPGVLNLVVATRDAHGVLRTLDEVEKLIRALISEAFAADPFLEKLADLPEVVARLRAAQRLSDLGRPEGEQISAAVTAELRAVLGEIRELNRKHTREVRADRSIAFGLATFEGNAASPVGADLRGVHASADAWLRQQFQRTAQPAGDEPSYVDEDIYLDGLRALATHELAKDNFMHWVNMVGLPLLAVFFPVVAGGIGLVQAGLGARTAHEHVELQRGMLGGDEILSRADVEMESAAAGIGLGLGLLPLVGRLSSATRAAGALARGETTAARLAREALLEFTSRLGALTVPQLTAMFLQELVTANVLGLAVSEAVGAVARSVAEQYRYQAGGSLDPDAMRALIEQALTEAAELTEEAP